MIEVLCVGAGGFVGAICRYLTGIAFASHLYNGIFPLSTLCINLAGSFLIGLFSVCIPALSPQNPHPLLFLSTGLLGGFTTFSTFSLESVGLLESGEFGVAIGYMVLSIVLCVAGAFAGRMLGNLLCAQS